MNKLKKKFVQNTLLEGWMDGWMEGKARLRIAHSNQKLITFDKISIYVDINLLFLYSSDTISSRQVKIGLQF